MRQELTSLLGNNGLPGFGRLLDFKIVGTFTPFRDKILQGVVIKVAGTNYATTGINISNFGTGCAIPAML